MRRARRRRGPRAAAPLRLGSPVRGHALTAAPPERLAPTYLAALLWAALVVPAALGLVVTLVLAAFSFNVGRTGFPILLPMVIAIAGAPFGLLFGLVVIATRHLGGPISRRRWTVLVGSGILVCGLFLGTVIGGLWIGFVPGLPIAVAAAVVYRIRRRIGLTRLFESQLEPIDPSIFE